jgi:hypothetical protein
VPEWSNGLAWKACIRQKRIEGSNPSLSATRRGRLKPFMNVFDFHLDRMVTK